MGGFLRDKRPSIYETASKLKEILTWQVIQPFWEEIKYQLSRIFARS